LGNEARQKKKAMPKEKNHGQETSPKHNKKGSIHTNRNCRLKKSRVAKRKQQKKQGDPIEKNKRGN